MTKCWSDLTLNRADTVVNVEALVVEECRRTISYLKGYSYPKLYCKKLSNQKPTANTVSFLTKKKQLYTACVLRVKNFYLSNLLSICAFLYEANLNKAKL